MNAVSLNNLWTYLQGLPLSVSNQRWLGERLIEASANIKPLNLEQESNLYDTLAANTVPYTMEELNDRIDAAEAEIDCGEGKTYEEMMAGFRKEISWLK